MAALIVFFGHAAGHLTGGFLWQLAPYLDAAVIVFFVLSGYVIAYIVDTRENNIESYLIARISRLWSIIVPALILTVICNYIGIEFSNNPSIYFNGPWEAPDADPIFLSYFLSFFLVQHVWDLGLNPPMNGPFWSLTYEFIYYLLFAALVFFKGKKRVGIFITICLIAGPDIMLLFPIWMLGAMIYHAHKKYMQLLQEYRLLSSIVAIVALLGFIYFVPVIRKVVDVEIAIQMSDKNIFASYLYTFLICIHLFCVPPLLSLCAKLIIRIGSIVTYFASMTFALYLFHRPLLQMFAAFCENVSSPSSRFLILGGTVSIIFLIGRPCEEGKYYLKSWLVKLANRLKSY
jgi:peptidoglycan/LPS O-acetylase OafA/YrhL